jgi:5-carboxymethyl-2-hydroxymuconate isomerase
MPKRTPGREDRSMPHIIVEYSANLEPELDLGSLLDAIHVAALATGVFPIGGLRTRVARRDTYRIADCHPGNAFIHLQLRIGAGRPADVRQRAAEQVFQAVTTTTASIFAGRALGLSLEVVEIDPVGSLKHNNLHEAVQQRAGDKTS